MATNNIINWNQFSNCSVYLSADIANITGDGSVYSIAFDRESFDINNDFAAGVFVAPVAGVYNLSANLWLANVGAGHTIGWLSIYNRTTATSLAQEVFNGALSRDSANYCFAYIETSYVLAAGDTIEAQTYVDNSTKTITLIGSDDPSTTYFCCSLKYRT